MTASFADAMRLAGVTEMLTNEPTDNTVTLNDLPPPVSSDAGDDMTSPGNTDDGDGDGSNQPANDKARFMREVRGFGEAEGKGNNAKPSLYLTACTAAFKGWIVEDDAEVVQSTYSKGRAKAKGIGWTEEKSAAQQISKVKCMIRLGAMTTVNGPDVLARVCNKIMDKVRAGEKLDKTAGDILLTAARVQIGQPDSEITDDQIDAAMSKSAPAQKIEADLLGTLRDAAEKLRVGDDLPISEESREMLDRVVLDIANRVKELGGTTKERAEIEKAMKAKLKADMAAEKAGARIAALGLRY